MSRLVFRDFDEFADSIDGIAGRFVPTARSTADWWVDAVPAGALGLQQIQIGGDALADRCAGFQQSTVQALLIGQRNAFSRQREKR